jgi:hypothetical protein
MASSRQIAANRANAQKSTGPRTANGKDQSSRNAIKHGLTSTRTLIGQEDPVEYHELRGSLFKSYAPANTQEEILVDRIASASWRTLRSRQMEQSLCNMSINEWQGKRKGELPRTPKTENEALVISMVEDDLWKLMFRYDTQISRDFFRSVATLEKMQKDRRIRERQEANDSQLQPQPQETKARPGTDWLPFEITRTADAHTPKTAGATISPQEHPL